MYHSIIFWNEWPSFETKEEWLTFLSKNEKNMKNTWADWYLIPSSRPVINPPEVKTKFVDVPGADWHLDLSTVLTGDVTYGSRTGSIEFIVDNGQLSEYRAETWSKLYSEIMNYLHGKLLKATLEDDPSFYYQGRFAVNDWASDEHNSKITIDYTLSPFKYEKFSSLEDWEWDTFNFETDIIRNYKDLRVDGILTLKILGRRMAVTPSFIVNSDDGEGLSVVFNGSSYHLDDGTSRVINIRTKEGENTLKFYGHGTVSVDYRGGCL